MKEETTQKGVGGKNKKRGAVLFLLVSLVCTAGAVYIAQINRVAIMGQEIKEKERAIETLKKQNDSLRLRAAEFKSIHSLEEEKDRMGMQQPREVGQIEVALR